MRFHIPALAHFPVSEKYEFCSHTQKIVKLSKMLLSLGHEVYIYGHSDSDVVCTEFVPTHTQEDVNQVWGKEYDWHKELFNEEEFTRLSAYTLKPKFITNAIIEINKRKKSDDFLFCILGIYHKAIADAVGLKLTVEPSIGYVNVFAQFKAYESHAIRNIVYGGEYNKRIIRPSFTDRVIPNYYDTKDFAYNDKKQAYYLYLGRVTQGKGVGIAIKAAIANNARIVIAGLGGSYDKDTGTFYYEDGLEKAKYDKLTYLGYANAELKKKLLSNATALFTPSLYTEPFGNAAVEAQLSGTPVITSGHGAFPETIIHGTTGYICWTQTDYNNAVEKVKNLDHKTIYRHAQRYTLDVVKQEYQDWFDQLYKNVHLC